MTHHTEQGRSRGRGDQNLGRTLRAALLRVLVLLMVPVLIVFTPRVADAAVNGDAASATFVVDAGAVSDILGTWMECDLTGYFRSTDPTLSPVLHARMTCESGYNIQEAEVGLSFSSAGCSYTWAQERVDGEGTGDRPLGNVMASTGTYNASSCAITEVCYSGRVNTWSSWGWDDFDGGCIPFPLGGPPVDEVVQGCTHAAPGKAYVGPKVGETGSNNTTRWTRRGYVPFVRQPPTSQQWVFYVVVKDAITGQKIAESGAAYTYRTLPGVSPFATGQYNTSNYGAPGQTDHPETARIAGVGAFLDNGNYSLNIRMAGPPTTGAGRVVGMNAPASCFFYWGEKWYDDASATNTNDEPASDLGTEPLPGEDVGWTGDDPDGDGTPGAEDETPAECAWSWSDPATWVPAAICKVMDLMRTIWQDFLSRIPQWFAALWEGLVDLFTPDPSSWGWDGLRAQWEARPPGSIVTGFGDGFSGVASGFSSANGCGTLADFTTDDIAANLTCDQARSTPGYGALYGLVQAGLIGLTCWGLWRIVRGVID